MFPSQCILTSKSPRNTPTRHASPRPWWSRTPTASAPSAPCPRARRWVFTPQNISHPRGATVVAACSHLRLSVEFLDWNIVGVFAWESSVTLTYCCGNFIILQQKVLSCHQITLEKYSHTLISSPVTHWYIEKITLHHSNEAQTNSRNYWEKCVCVFVCVCVCVCVCVVIVCWLLWFLSH